MRDGERVFAKPHEEEQDFEQFLDYVIAQEKDPSSTGEIRYAQTRTSLAPFSRVSSLMISGTRTTTSGTNTHP